MTTNSDKPLSPLAGAGLGLLALGIFLGAFGAHALAPRVSEQALQTYKTGQLYHLVGALALLAIGILDGVRPEKGFRLAGWLVLSGTLIFALTLYLLAVTGVRWLGAITPLGGVLLIAGCSAAAWSAGRLASRSGPPPAGE